VEGLEIMMMMPSGVPQTPNSGRAREVRISLTATDQNEKPSPDFCRSLFLGLS